jgi:tRNA(Ile)-lysidine synthase
MNAAARTAAWPILCASDDADSREAVGQAFARRLNRDATRPLVVALSGGSDSLALLAITCAWAAEVGRRVLAVTVDHRLQPQSAAWTRAAEAAALAMGAEHRSLNWTGPKPLTGVPAAARAARLGDQAVAAREAGATVILLGHTRDDAAENAVMRQAGSTLGGLAEWSPSPVWPQGRELFHFRPLLSVRRADLRQGLRAAGRDWIDDPANDDLRYARPRARAALAGALGTAAPVAALDGEIARLALQVRIEPWGFSLDREPLLAATPAVAARVLAAALVCAGGQERLPRTAQVQALLDRLRQAPFVASLAGARIEAGQTIRMMREAGEAGRGRRTAKPLPLIEGMPTVWDGRFEITACDGRESVQALAGLANQLTERQRLALKALPSAARLSPPAIVSPEGQVICPVLAEAGSPRGRTPVCLPLWGPRLLAACGVTARED